MGTYINKGNDGFVKYITCEYVDKTGLIGYVNRTLGSSDMLTCVTRPRRFGKSMAAQMLNAYYDQSSDSDGVFSRYEIANDDSYRLHLNQYPTIYIDITDFITSHTVDTDIVAILQKEVMQDLEKAFPTEELCNTTDLMDALYKIAKSTGQKFILIIDEWDAIYRESKANPNTIDSYTRLLRRLFKGSNTAAVFAGVYMTGILPIKKYGTQSALNDFREYSMIDPGRLVPYIGFTDAEVVQLARRYGLDIKELRHWYDGYELKYNKITRDKDGNGKLEQELLSIYNPNSVMSACNRGAMQNYWSKTESFESLQHYIDMDFDGVQQTLKKLIRGEHVQVSTIRYGNDLNEINTTDELFTLLVHLGYLSYDPDTRTAVIPNQEIRDEFTEALRGSSHKDLSAMIKASDALLVHTLESDEDYVAREIEDIHRRETAAKFYNNEQALRSVVCLAYISAREDYIEIQEMPGGEGFADIVFIPRRNSGKPMMIVELKWNHTADSAIQQIKDKKYPEQISALSSSDLLFVGITYDKESKQHSCKIERLIDKR